VSVCEDGTVSVEVKTDAGKVRRVALVTEEVFYFDAVVTVVVAWG